MADITAVIATFNSEKKVINVIESLKNQILNGKTLEILVVDGGSKDKTREISKNSGCKVIDNPLVEPVNAKYLGLKYASGDYLIFLDHDEVMQSKFSIINKINSMIKYDLSFVLSTGYVNPPGANFVNTYINEFGDPFSYFIYKSSKFENYFLEYLNAKYKLFVEDSQCIVFVNNDSNDFSIIELVAGSSAINLNKIKNYKFFNRISSSILPHLFYLIRREDRRIAVMKKDYIVHDSSETYSAYLNKIKWRVKNNIFFKKKMGAAGYSGREQYMSSRRSLRKYFFVPYGMLVVPLVIDAILLSIKRKNFKYLCHIFFTEITLMLIIWYQVIKLFGYKEDLKSYDGSTIIKKD